MSISVTAAEYGAGHRRPEGRGVSSPATATGTATIEVITPAQPKEQGESSPATATGTDTAEELRDTSQPASVTGNIVFTVLMLGLAIIGLGLMTGFFPLTVMGLALEGIALIGGALVFLWQHRN